ncbi:transcriptional regulator [Paraburkholderia acidisoli]|uniref:Transcriptional regulator n=1 Tax=Paraburkholderia acidisoli TaxID=2571748 RepID=A0A7Z2JH26_9BURK|nr:transcriptional regulator [Paraburkholderia acidisoli]QGZ64371.1 transcriptional regulator [Paraburkholderia acidisoli]
MDIQPQKAAFAERLRLAMQSRPEPLRGATALARLLNDGHAAGMPISPQTAHKWLSGRTVPKSDTFGSLACLLGVDVLWLRYGLSGDGVLARFSPRAAERVRKVDRLNPVDQCLVEVLVSRLVDADPGEDESQRA